MQEPYKPSLLAALLCCLVPCGICVWAPLDDGASASAGKTALLVVDVQPCFLPGGSLPTPMGDVIIDVIVQQLLHGSYAAVAFSLDCHPPGHISFLSAHPAPISSKDHLELVYTSSGQLCNHQHLFPEPLSVACPEEAVQQVLRSAPTHALPGEEPAGTSCEALVAVNQTLWPAHCVAGTLEAQLHPRLSALLQPLAPSTPAPHRMCTPANEPHMCQDVLRYSLLRAHTQDVQGEDHVPVLVVLKARQPHIDAYSAFFDNGHLSHTGLHDALSQLHITHLHVVGLALDVCVAATALDGVRLGYNVTVVQDGCRAVEERQRHQVLQQLQARGVGVCSSSDLGLNTSQS